MKRATTLLAMAAAMTVAMPYQMRAIRRIEKGETTAGDQERIAKAEAKRARKNAKRRRPQMRFVFLSGEANPLNFGPDERRFMVVMDEPSNACSTPDNGDKV